MPVLEAVLEADYIPELQPKARKSVLVFAKLMQGLKEIADNETSVTKMVEEILDRTGYRNLLLADDSPSLRPAWKTWQSFSRLQLNMTLKPWG